MKSVMKIGALVVALLIACLAWDFASAFQLAGRIQATNLADVWATKSINEKVLYLAICPALESAQVKHVKGNTYRISVEGPNPHPGSVPTQGEIFIDPSPTFADGKTLYVCVGWSGYCMATVSPSARFSAGTELTVPANIRRIAINAGSKPFTICDIER